MPGSEQPSPTPKRRASKSPLSTGGHNEVATGGTNERAPGGLQRRFVDALAWFIVVAWAAGFLLDIVRPSYDPPAVLHGLMLTVAGAAFGASVVRRNGNGNGG